jgi:hypothetical protein
MMTASLVPTSLEDGNTQPIRREAFFASPLAMYERQTGSHAHSCAARALLQMMSAPLVPTSRRTAISNPIRREAYFASRSPCTNARNDRKPPAIFSGFRNQHGKNCPVALSISIPREWCGSSSCRRYAGRAGSTRSSRRCRACGRSAPIRRRAGSATRRCTPSCRC